MPGLPAQILKVEPPEQRPAFWCFGPLGEGEAPAGPFCGPFAGPWGWGGKAAVERPAPRVERPAPRVEGPVETPRRRKNTMTKNKNKK